MNYREPFESTGAEELQAARLRGLAAPRLEPAAAMPFRERWKGLRRAWPRLAAWTAICVGLALTYCLFATPKFLVTTDVVLEPRQPILSTDSAAQSLAPALDSATADSQVQVLMSERNLNYVFDMQHLQTDPEFAQSGFSPFGWLLGLPPFLAEPPLPPEEQARRNRQMAFENFSAQVSVKRLAQSYAFELSFYADDPQKAARIANAITAAYIRDKVIYNIAAAEAQRGGDFLENRVADIKTETDAATNAVKSGVIPDYVFGHADARIISPALAPLRKTYPKTGLILALAAAFGVVSGVVGVVVADELDRRVRSASRLRILTGLAVLAALPVVKAGRKRPDALMQWAQSAAQSRFATEIRNLRIVALRIAEDGGRPAIGVLSYRRGEGRSVVAANLAALIAETGAPVALVDADTLHPTLTRAYAPQAGQAADAWLLVEDVAPNFSILPARSGDIAADPNGVVEFRATIAACAGLAESHLVIADLPPLSESLESVAVARRLTGVFVVADAATITIDEFLELLSRLAENDVRVLGVALNRAERS